jgi:hypothetical protein
MIGFLQSCSQASSARWTGRGQGRRLRRRRAALRPARPVCQPRARAAAWRFFSGSASVTVPGGRGGRSRPQADASPPGHGRSGGREAATVVPEGRVGAGGGLERRKRRPLAAAARAPRRGRAPGGRCPGRWCVGRGSSRPHGRPGEPGPGLHNGGYVKAASAAQGGPCEGKRR